MAHKDRFGLAGKTALITGAGQGLGFEIAQNLSREGMQILIADIDNQKGKEATDQIRNEGGQADFFTVDLGSSESVTRMIERVVEKYQGLHLLINNAKANASPSTEEMSLENWDRSMKVTLSGSFYCCRAVIPVMEKAGGGCIINISSIAATSICNESPDYHVAKAGVSHLTRHLAYWAGPKGIRVNDISPGFIIKKENIPRYEADKKWKNRWEWCHPLRRAGYSEDLSNAILFLASDLSSFITGQNLVIDGGLTLSEPGDLLTRYTKETW
jgi:NAD(P)-dependent dehydrogenase (short-subunit alcohol dehydrogenase family)